MQKLFIYTIRKEEIISMNFRRFEDSFGHWPEFRGSKLRKLFDCLTLFVEGYDNHNDEIYMIPEVRKFFIELHRRWPWWAYFVCDVEANLAIPYLCLIDHVESIKRANDLMCTAAFNPVHLLEIIQADYGRMNYLMDRAGMTDQENNKRSQQILDLFVPRSGGAK